MKDPWLRAAVLCSATRFPSEILKSLLVLESNHTERTEMIQQLVATAAAGENESALHDALGVIAPSDPEVLEPWRLSALTSLVDALERRGGSLASLASSAPTQVRTAVERIEKSFETAFSVVKSASADDAAREAAIRFVARSSRKDDALRWLASWLSGDAPLRLQTAAVEALAHIANPKVPDLLLTGWERHSPALRATIVSRLLSRDEWVRALLDALEKGVVASSEISPANRQRLVRNKNTEIHRRAQTLFAATQASRSEALARFKNVGDLTGDAARGAMVFEKNCAPCHALGDRGHAVGPDLATFRNKSAEDFLVAILDPSAAIEPRFISYQVETRDGRSLSGVIKAETATSLALVQGGGVEETILRRNIAEIKASNLSLMPDGLEQNITPQDLADLIACLKNLGPAAFGGASPEQASKARAEFLRSGANGAARIVVAAEQLSYASWLGTLPLAICRQTDGKSRVIWETAPFMGEPKPDTRHHVRLAAAMGYVSQDAGRFDLKLNSKPVLTFDVTLHDETWKSADGKVSMHYQVLENNDEDSNGVVTIDLSDDLLEPGKPARFEVIGSSSNSQRWFGVYELPERE